MYGATNILSKSMSYAIIHTPVPLLSEYLRSDLRREMTANLLSKLAEVVSRINSRAGFNFYYAFISDSCNVMTDLRNECPRSCLFKSAYGCINHCLHNPFEDLRKSRSISIFIKQSLYVFKTIKNTGLNRKVFDRICAKKCGKVYIMVMYSKSRWSNVNLMFASLIHVRCAITYLPY